MPFNQEFNYSAACNTGYRSASGELLLFLNNDIEILDPGWLDELVRWGQLPGVGGVGTKLLYPDGQIQHAGVIVGMHHPYGLIYNKAPEGTWGVFGSPDVYRNYAAIMGACQLIRAGSLKRSAALTSVTTLPTATWRFACGPGRPATALSTPPTPPSFTTKATPAARSTRPKISR